MHSGSCLDLKTTKISYQTQRSILLSLASCSINSSTYPSTNSRLGARAPKRTIPEGPTTRHERIARARVPGKDQDITSSNPHRKTLLSYGQAPLSAGYYVPIPHYHTDDLKRSVGKSWHAPRVPWKRSGFRACLVVSCIGGPGRHACVSRHGRSRTGKKIV